MQEFSMKKMMGSMNKGSKAQGTAVGSGSKPSGGKMNIPTSAPADKHGQGRKPAGWLK
jgi:hypothetical protein